jgi:hypothetical protein
VVRVLNTVSAFGNLRSIVHTANYTRRLSAHPAGCESKRSLESGALEPRMPNDDRDAIRAVRRERIRQSLDLYRSAWRVQSLIGVARMARGFAEATRVRGRRAVDVSHARRRGCKDPRTRR